MLSQVYILKAKNRNDDARHICETILTQYRTSFWAGEAMQQLRLLKPLTTSTPAPTTAPTIPPMLAVPPAPAPQAPPAPNQPQGAPSPKKPESEGCDSHRPFTAIWLCCLLPWETARSAVATGAAGLTFGELELLPRAGLPGFLALFHAGVAAQQTLGFERGSQICIDLKKRSRDGELCRAGLAHYSAAIGVNE